MWGVFYVCCPSNSYRSAIITGNLPCHEKFMTVPSGKYWHKNSLSTMKKALAYTIHEQARSKNHAASSVGRINKERVPQWLARLR